MTGVVAALGGVGLIDYPDLQTEAVVSPYYTMQTNGSIIHDENVTGLLKWIVNGAPTNYEVQFASGGWQDFSTDRTINATSLIELRDKYSLAVVKTVTVTLT